MTWDAALRRIHETTATRTQVELAQVLGIRQSSVSDAKRRGVVPPAWLVTLLTRYGVSPAWVRTGQGPRYLVPANAPAAIPPAPPLMFSPGQLDILLRALARWRQSGQLDIAAEEAAELVEVCARISLSCSRLIAARNRLGRGRIEMMDLLAEAAAVRICVESIRLLAPDAFDAALEGKLDRLARRLEEEQ